MRHNEELTCLNTKHPGWEIFCILFYFAVEFIVNMETVRDQSGDFPQRIWNPPTPDYNLLHPLLQPQGMSSNNVAFSKKGNSSSLFTQLLPTGA